MKISAKLCAFSAAMIIFTLTACGNSGRSKPVDIPEDFSSNVTITDESTKYKAKIQRGGGDIWEFRFSSPKTVEGMKVLCSGKSCKVDFNGLSYTVQRDNLSKYSMISLAVSSIEALINKRDVTCTNIDGIVKESGTVSGQDFVATIKKGKLARLDISDSLSYKFA